MENIYLVNIGQNNIKIAVPEKSVIALKQRLAELCLSRGIDFEKAIFQIEDKLFQDYVDLGLDSLEEVPNFSKIRVIPVVITENKNNTSAVLPRQKEITSDENEASDTPSELFWKTEKVLASSRANNGGYVLPKFSAEIQQALDNKVAITYTLRKAIIDTIHQDFLKVSLYPKRESYSVMANALVTRYPHLRDSVPPGYDSWRVCIINKFKNERKNMNTPEVLATRERFRRKSTEAIPQEVTLEEETNSSELVRGFHKRNYFCWKDVKRQVKDKEAKIKSSIAKSGDSTTRPNSLTLIEKRITALIGDTPTNGLITAEEPGCSDMVTKDEVLEPSELVCEQDGSFSIPSSTPFPILLVATSTAGQQEQSEQCGEPQSQHARQQASTSDETAFTEGKGQKRKHGDPLGERQETLSSMGEQAAVQHVSTESHRRIAAALEDRATIERQRLVLEMENLAVKKRRLAVEEETRNILVNLVTCFEKFLNK